MLWYKKLPKDIMVTLSLIEQSKIFGVQHCQLEILANYQLPVAGKMFISLQIKLCVIFK